MIQKLGRTELLRFLRCVLLGVCLFGTQNVWSQTETTDAVTSEPQAAQPIVPPKLISQPSASPDSSVFGAVLFEVTINVSGIPENIVVKESSQNIEFDQWAIGQMGAHRFEPAYQGSEAIAVRILFKFEVQPIDPPASKEKALAVGNLGGRLYLKGTTKPMVGASVQLPASEREVVTDEQGRFLFEGLPIGTHRVRIEEDGFFTSIDSQEVRADQLTEVQYYIEPESAGAGVVTVRARRPKREVTRRTLEVKEIVKVPGVNGDVVKVVQNLPGVARVPFGGGGLVIRGSNPGDAGAVVNGHFVPLIFHFGGIRSVLPSELIQRLDFYPGNFSTKFGRFSGGIVDLELKRPDSNWAVRAEADVFDAGFFVSGPITENLRFAVAGRRSYVDAILSAVASGQDGLSFTVAPRYYDYQAMLAYDVQNHKLTLFAFGSDDALDFLLDKPINNDPALRGDFENQTRFFRLYGAVESRLTKQLTNELSVSTGPNQVFAQLGTNLKFDNYAYVVTARDELRYRANGAHEISIGFDLETYQAELDISAPFPPKEGGDRGLRLGSRELIQAQRKTEIFNLAGWFEHEWKAYDGRFSLISGLRYDYDRRLEEGNWDPRFSSRLVLMPKKWAIKGAVGWFTQRPSPDESDESFGNPEIESERAIHYSLGTEHQLSENVELDVVGFYKDLYHLVVVPPINLDQPLSVDANGRPLTNEGYGRSYGLEVLLRHAPTASFFGWVSYTLMRSERWDQALNRYRVFDFDQTHILTLLGQYKLNSRWGIGARYRYVTGIPRTPYVGSVYNSDVDAYDPILGVTNSTRLPDFQQLDLRVDRTWRYDTWTLEGYFEVQNVTNTQNVEGYQYDFDFANKRPVTSLPIIPSLGLRGVF